MSFWKNPDRQIILASASPRRKQILTQMGLEFNVVVTKEFNEFDFLDSTYLDRSLQLLAAKKAEMVADSFPEALVVGADTVVVHATTPLGKPADYEDAYTMLQKLSGKAHQVMTGVALICKAIGYKKTAITTTEVVFRPISDREIKEYLSSDEYCDKAGAYAIQGKALVFVESIKGCFYNVVGLPVASTIELFQEFVNRKECVDV